MHESDLPVDDATESADLIEVEEELEDEVVEPEPEPDPAAAAAEAELDGLNEAFDTVDAAMKAIDADDLDQAEALAASLGDTSAVDTTDAEPEPSSED